MSGMICEMCGKEVPLTKTVVIEGSRLNVCPNCARFGEDYRANQSGAPISTSVITLPTMVCYCVRICLYQLTARAS